MKPVLNKPPFCTGYNTYEIKDGIFYIERHVRDHFTIEAFKEITQYSLEYTEGIAYPVIIFGKDMMSIEKAARDYMLHEGAQNKLSRAFVVEKKQSKLALQFFMQTQKQPIPMEVFEEMAPAIEWSKQFTL
jgi:hypothetical protein